MRVDLFDVKEFIELNHLKEVTSPILFQKGAVPHPDGLISNEIFGVTTKSRKETFAYIDLGGYYFHPHIYKAIRRMFAGIDKIVNGETYYSINENGQLVVDNVNGQTGIKFLYDNWDSIKFSFDPTSTGMRTERATLVNETPKNEVFMRYQIVIPVFYRDIRSNSTGGETDDINNLYVRLIRLASATNSGGLFDFQFFQTEYNIQTTIVDIYDYFKSKIQKKSGLIRKYLMGKNCDYCTRSVITTPSYHANRPEELKIDFEHALIPISQICTLCYPFMVHYIKTFFEREILDNQNNKVVYNQATDTIETVELDNPDAIFNDKYIKKMLDQYMRDQSCRFTKIEVPVKGNRKSMYLALSGRRMDGYSTLELAPIVNRPMTWTDLLYIAAVDVTKDKHCIVTRYPLLDEFGLFIAKIRVASTLETVPMYINDTLYKWYPKVDMNVDPHAIGSMFIDSLSFSNSYLPGLDGDYIFADLARSWSPYKNKPL